MSDQNRLGKNALLFHY
uniref:Uncharacterized protein n=1 Tax=Anguilla anguilla TaxID=7936 RepID=A0A0E9XU91_ANGAN